MLVRPEYTVIVIFLIKIDSNTNLIMSEISFERGRFIYRRLGVSDTMERCVCM